MTILTEELAAPWAKHAAMPAAHPELTGKINADICVIGSGITGLTTAYLLQKSGRSVALLDSHGLATGDSARTTAHLTAVLDDRFHHLEIIHGREKATLAIQSHIAAIDRIEAIAREENILCDFERGDGFLVASQMPRDEDTLHHELDSLTRAGFTHCDFVERVNLRGTRFGPAIAFRQQAQFHVLKYLAGLASAFKLLGGRIYGHSHVVEIKGGENAYAETTTGGHVSCHAVVVATYSPVCDWVVMHTKQESTRTYVVGIEMPGRVSQPFLLWDLEDPYHYVRSMHYGDSELLLVGGEDHRTGTENDANARFQHLEDWARGNFNGLGRVAVRWSGQIIEPVDGLAFIGRNPMDDDNVYIATGFSGNGMTYGTIAGMLISDLIQGNENPWVKVYDPSRKSLLSAGTYIRNAMSMAGNMISSVFKQSDVADEAQIMPGEGAVVRQGNKKVAVYRDEQGALHKCSAICTHMGCTLNFNAAERTWDCGCHGSRFNTEGEVLNGPAIKDLEKL